MNRRLLLATVLALALLLAGCADRYSRRSAADADADGDGTSDQDDPDDDNDGKPDAEDLASWGNANVTFALASVRPLVVFGSGPARLHVEIENATGNVTRFPATGELVVEEGGAAALDDIEIDIPDDQRSHRFTLRVLTENGSEFDVNAKPGVLALDWTILLPSGAIAGSPFEGPSSGRDDGEPRQLDAVLEYVVFTR